MRALPLLVVSAALCAPLAACSSPSGHGTGPTTCDTAPVYSGDATLFGTSLSSSDGSLDEALQLNDDRFGRLPVVRQFDPEIPPPDAWSRRAAAFSGRAVITSFRAAPSEVIAGRFDERLRDWFREAPTGDPIFWSYFHEPERHIDEGEFTAGEYKRAWRHIVGIAASVCSPDLYPTLILTGWTSEPESGRDWRDYYPGSRYVSVLAWDPYNSATSVPTSYVDPAVLFESVVARSEESGKPWGIAETGTQLVPGDEGSGRAAWLSSTAAFLETHGAAFVTYFQSTRDGDFKLTDDASIGAWRDWVSGSGDSVVQLGWAGGTPVLTGSAAHAELALEVHSLDGGEVRASDASSPDPAALRFPEFRDAVAVPRAVLGIHNTGAHDLIDPAEANFTFGAEVNIDSASQGSAVDNGDNVVQRGLSSDETLFKAEVDDRHPSCTVRGAGGQVTVRADRAISPERWYRVLCHRVEDEVVLEVTDLEDGSQERWRRTGVIGPLRFADPAIPLAIGGKLAHNGEPVRSATDQFNGSLARPVFRR